MAGQPGGYLVEPAERAQRGEVATLALIRGDRRIPGVAARRGASITERGAAASPSATPTMSRTQGNRNACGQLTSTGPWPARNSLKPTTERRRGPVTASQPSGSLVASTARIRIRSAPAGICCASIPMDRQGR
jgi:hypothetical protein